MFLANVGSPTSDNEDCSNDVWTLPSKIKRYAGKQDIMTTNCDTALINCSVVNALNTLWVCKNAMNPKHECQMSITLWN